MLTTSEKHFKYYFYIAIRFLRYLIIALFIAVFPEHEIVGPIILICANLVEIVYVVKLKIWVRHRIAMILKVA